MSTLELCYLFGVFLGIIIGCVVGVVISYTPVAPKRPTLYGSSLVSQTTDRGGHRETSKEFYDRYQRYFNGEISYEELHSKK